MKQPVGNLFESFHKELFFSLLAEEAATNQEAQNSISQTMESLCPPGGSTGLFTHQPNHLTVRGV